MRNVASRSSQHSKMFGQPASWQTVCRPSRLTSSCSSVYCGPIRARVLIHSGFRSIGVAALRTSNRNNLRPSGAGAAGAGAAAVAGAADAASGRAPETGWRGLWVTRPLYAGRGDEPNGVGPGAAGWDRVSAQRDGATDGEPDGVSSVIRRPGSGLAG